MPLSKYFANLYQSLPTEKRRFVIACIKSEKLVILWSTPPHFVHKVGRKPVILAIRRTALFVESCICLSRLWHRFFCVSSDRDRWSTLRRDKGTDSTRLPHYASVNRLESFRATGLEEKNCQFPIPQLDATFRATNNLAGYLFSWL